MLLILGEAYGEREEALGEPFVGVTGWHLDNMLRNAGIVREKCFLTNVFNKRPKGNKIENFCGGKGVAIKGYPSLAKGYVRAEFQGELNRLAREIKEFKPNLILALGATACWAMLGKTTISKYRGVTEISTYTVPGIKVLPTYHPAAMLRGAEAWALRPIIQMDIVKAAKEQTFPDIRRPNRMILIEPTLEDIRDFKRQYLDGAKRVAVDIETSGDQITCIGFAPSKNLALVVPFYDSRRAGRNYWASEKVELQVWEIISEILGDKRNSKIFQNGLYDISFLWRSYGIKVWNAEEDTMLLHHALQPESLKGLGFLGSMYTDEGPWKQMRDVGTIKGDD